MTDAEVRVDRGGLGEVQALAAAYARESAEAGLSVEPLLPTSAMFWLARVGDEPAGYAAAVRGPQNIIVGPVYVHPAHRRRGIGLALLRRIEELAEESAIPLVEVSVAGGNEEGVRFLESLGYRVRRVLMERRTPRSEGGGTCS